MPAPVPAVGDGALGFWKAVREVFPKTKEQRCWFHAIANVLAALPWSWGVLLVLGSGGSLVSSAALKCGAQVRPGCCGGRGARTYFDTSRPGGYCGAGGGASVGGPGGGASVGGVGGRRRGFGGLVRGRGVTVLEFVGRPPAGVVVVISEDGGSGTECVGAGECAALDRSGGGGDEGLDEFIRDGVQAVHCLCAGDADPV